MSEHKHYISIWFFIGTLLLVYGILIFSAGVYHLFAPEKATVVLANLHADLWGGLILLALGGFYFLHFFPGRKGS